MARINEIKVKRGLGNSIKKYRGQLKISQEELSFRAGLHRNYVSDAERGTRNVSIIALTKIARALEISLPELVNYEI